MTRFSAAAIHFGISMLVGAVLLALCWFVWYPAPMLMAIGGHEIFLLIVGIDVIVGPLLTLVVFKTGKKALKFDLAVIAILQVCAMMYGVSTLLEARPAYVVALGDKFKVVQASELTPTNIAKGGVVLPWFGPTWVGTKAPVDPADVHLVQSLGTAGFGREQMPQLYIPYNEMTAELLQKAQAIEVLKKNSSDGGAEIDRWLTKHDHNDQSAKFQSIKIGGYEFVVVLDASTAEVIGIAPFGLQSPK